MEEERAQEVERKGGEGRENGSLTATVEARKLESPRLEFGGNTELTSPTGERCRVDVGCECECTVEY